MCLAIEKRSYLLCTTFWLRQSIWVDASIYFAKKMYQVWMKQ